MDPAFARDAQIVKYREMTGEQSSKIALDLHESAARGDLARARFVLA
jgi:hypothetical protein